MNKALPKFHPKHLNWLMPLILSCLMSGSISLINIVMNRGFFDGIWVVWIKTWAMSWLIAFPLILIFLPVVRKILMRFVKTMP